MFIDRAVAVRPGFAESDADTATIAELCRRLSGIPLAIELAAARTMTRTPAEILTDIVDHAGRLADRHRSTPRHRSLAAVLDWSYSLLAPIDDRCSCTSPCSRADSPPTPRGAVIDRGSSDAVLDALTELVEHSLLSAVDVSGVTRFMILEPIREHAERRLADSGQLEEVRRRHAAWFARWIDAADAGLRGSDEAIIAHVIAHELPNLRAAHTMGPRPRLADRRRDPGSPVLVRLLVRRHRGSATGRSPVTERAPSAPSAAHSLSTRHCRARRLARGDPATPERWRPAG